jgi:hypothetical protein
MLLRMTRSRPLLATLCLVSATLAVTAIWLVLHNPTIDDTSRGDDYTCLAPYDTVLNDADNMPGGEPPPDADQIGARCRDLGEVRFAQGVGVGGGAVVLAALTALLALRSRTC